MRLQNNYQLPKNNLVTLVGKFVSEFRLNHEVFGEKFFLTDLSIERLSGTKDIIPILISERLMDVTQNCVGKCVEVHGQFRSFSRWENGRNRLLLSVFVQEIRIADKEGENLKSNQIFLDGFLCKPPVYRKTPLGREIADLLLAVNRSYRKSDYIPCICWGRNAAYVSSLPVGAHFKVHGRIQSRIYLKKLVDGTSEERTALEVSVSELEVSEM